MNTPTTLPRLWLRLLTFRASHEDYESLTTKHLLAGLAACWLVGIGRYWDDPRATLLQHAGIGSVIYIFVLAAVLWLIVKPVAPDRFSYPGVLTFIALTAPPAALYAIPVEKWMTLEKANRTNLDFLFIVAFWRVALWMHYLRRLGQFRGWMVLSAAAMPLAIIFITLASLNLQHVVFNIMGGIREADKSSQDAAYSALFVLSYLSVPVSFLACLGWFAMVLQRRKERRAKTMNSPAV